MRYRTQHLMDSDTLRMMNIGLDKYKEINKHQLIGNLAVEMFKNIKVNIVDVKEPISGLRSEIDIYVIDEKQFDSLLIRMADLIYDHDEVSRRKTVGAIVKMIRNV